MLRARGHIVGIDFSGARDAAKRIWLTTALRRNGVLNVESCVPARTLLRDVQTREQTLAALANWIARQDDALIGLDFPFGLPQPLVPEKHWEDWVQRFSQRYPTCEHLRRACAQAAHGSELRRRTDRDVRTPFSPYNLRLYRQTWYGIAHLLAPLVRASRVCVLPMMPAKPGRPWVLEICPASTLKRCGLYRPYKGRTPNLRRARRAILDALCRREVLRFTAPGVTQAALDDAGGDALDSIIAALATARAAREGWRHGPSDLPYCVEGAVYV